MPHPLKTQILTLLEDFRKEVLKGVNDESGIASKMYVDLNRYFEAEEKMAIGICRSRLPAMDRETGDKEFNWVIDEVKQQLEKRLE